jgi:hypothetical protein
MQHPERRGIGDCVQEMTFVSRAFLLTLRLTSKAQVLDRDVLLETYERVCPGSSAIETPSGLRCWRGVRCLALTSGLSAVEFFSCVLTPGPNLLRPADSLTCLCPVVDLRIWCKPLQRERSETPSKPLSETDRPEIDAKAEGGPTRRGAT